jgi:guanine nucleotide-binding protein subunit alpha
MRVINSIPFTPAEIETYRQLIFANIVEGLRVLYTVIEDEGIECSEETIVCRVACIALTYVRTDASTQKAFSNIMEVHEIKDDEVYPAEYRAIFERVWNDSDVQKVILGQQVGLPDKYVRLDSLDSPLLRQLVSAYTSGLRYDDRIGDHLTKCSYPATLMSCPGSLSKIINPHHRSAMTPSLACCDG